MKKETLRDPVNKETVDLKKKKKWKKKWKKTHTKRRTSKKVNCCGYPSKKEPPIPKRKPVTLDEKILLNTLHPSRSAQLAKLIREGRWRCKT
jgi:hypothetical protein